MLDSDNLCLHRTDELLQCGDFCAASINPCVFHAGLFVLRPSMAVFKDMFHELEIGRENPDGAEQGCLQGHASRPMFHPSATVPSLKEPIASLWDTRWMFLTTVSLISNTLLVFQVFVPVPDFKSFAGTITTNLLWHEQPRTNLGYSAEVPAILIQAVMYLGITAIIRLARPSRVKLCYNRRPEKSIIPFVHAMLNEVGCTHHPVLSHPANDGVVRAIAVFGYALCWCSSCAGFTGQSAVLLAQSTRRESFFPRLGESTPLSGSSKLY
ncbi:hypothetical protein OPV22_006224 [Ensete ventricosum]|uniref:Uncharacterized protein n=1 Tax=Ensete ventricosum TaxID=4639 RepID=A0AAV8RIB8_ENSVE|nr:hypothetical protein OPV22_006224 [Ensete ventricosum]